MNKQTRQEKIRQQNEELRAARQRYRELFEFAPDSYLVTDPQGVIKEANQVASTMLNVADDILIGKPLRLYVDERDREGFSTQLAQVIEPDAPGKKARFELRMRPRGGGYFHADVVAAPVYDDDLTGVRWMLRDVTERVQAQQEREQLLSQVNQERRRAEDLAKTLKRERDTLQMIMENTHAHLAYLDADFNFVRVNTAYAEGSGHRKEDLVGRNHFDLFPNKENRKIFEQVRETGEPAFFYARPFIYADKSERKVTYWDWSLVPAQNDDGTVQGLVLSLLNITERERLMQQLEAEQAKLQAIIQNAPEGIVVVDDNARIILANTAAEEIYARQTPYGEAYESQSELCICYPDGTAYHPRNLPLTRSALDGESHKNVEMALVRPDGERRNLLVDTVPIRSSEGEISGAIGVFRDITHRKRIEGQVRRYAGRLQALHELDHAILAARSAEEIANAAMKHLQELVTYSQASVEVFDFQTNETSLLAFRGEEKPNVEKGWLGPLEREEMLHTLQAGRLQLVEDIQALSASPSTETLVAEGIRSYISAPLRAGNELIGALSLGMKIKGGPTPDQMDIIRDVADQLAIGIRQAQLYEQVQRYTEELEQRVATRTAQLRASEARFRAIFEQTAVGITLLDDQGRMMASNPALHEMLGVSGGEITNQAFTDFVHPDEDIETEIEIYQEIMSGERDHHRTVRRYVGKEDETRWANIVLSLVRGSGGEPRFAIAVVEDITEQKKAQAAMVQSEKLAMTGRLAASLAHEINNPLQTVIGCLGLAEESLAQDDDNEDDLEQYITLSHEELKRAARIVSRLRDLSRPTDVDVGEPTDVNELIERVLKLSQKKLNNQGINVIRHLKDDLPRPVLAPDRMQQVFLNLTLNAIDVMSEGDRLEVSTDYHEASDEIVVTFSDDGPGIPADALPHIFDPFFSTKSEGVGLGLFVSQNIVQRHGGRIGVENNIGKGCTFTVWLPM